MSWCLAINVLMWMTRITLSTAYDTPVQFLWIDFQENSLENLLYTKDDMNKYMLLAHKHKHQSQSRLLSNRGYKYKRNINVDHTQESEEEIWKGTSRNDIERQCDRLRALRWSQRAGASSTIVRRFAPSGQQRSRQWDVVEEFREVRLIIN